MNKEAARVNSKSELVLKFLAFRPGQWVADIGVGGGYFALRFAEIVGRGGKVYAVDTDRKFLILFEKKIKKMRLKNIETVFVGQGIPELPKKSLDLVFLRNTYHHLSDRVRYFEQLKEFLKPGRRVAIIDYKPWKFRIFRKIFKHYTSPETIKAEMEQAGYKIAEDFNFLSKQSFMVFSVNVT